MRRVWTVLASVGLMLGGTTAVRTGGSFVQRMYLEAIKWVLGLTDGGSASHARAQ